MVKKSLCVFVLSFFCSLGFSENESNHLPAPNQRLVNDNAPTCSQLQSQVNALQAKLSEVIEEGTVLLLNSSDEDAQKWKKVLPSSHPAVKFIDGVTASRENRYQDSNKLLETIPSNSRFYGDAKEFIKENNESMGANTAIAKLSALLDANDIKGAYEFIKVKQSPEVEQSPFYKNIRMYAFSLALEKGLFKGSFNQKIAAIDKAIEEMGSAIRATGVVPEFHDTKGWLIYQKAIAYQNDKEANNKAVVDLNVSLALEDLNYSTMFPERANVESLSHYIEVFNRRFASIPDRLYSQLHEVRSKIVDPESKQYLTNQLKILEERIKTQN